MCVDMKALIEEKAMLIGHWICVTVRQRTRVTLDTDYDRKVIGQVTWHWYSEVHRLGIWDMEISIMA